MYLYLLPVKTEIIDFRDKHEKKYVPEITDVLRYWPMLQFYGVKVLEVP